MGGDGDVSAQGGYVSADGEAFVPFQTGLRFARALKLKRQYDWKQWCKSGARPANIPAGPDRVYKHDGWEGYRHWLGTDHQEQEPPLRQALSSVPSVSSLPQQSTPGSHSATYATEGVGLRQCDSGLTHRNSDSTTTTTTGKTGEVDCLPFAEAHAHARTLGLSSRRGWLEWYGTGVCPRGIPAWPSTKYKHDGWQGWGHWLGTTNTQAPLDCGTTNTSAGTTSTSAGQAVVTHLDSSLTRRDSSVRTAATTTTPTGNATPPDNTAGPEYLPFEQARAYACTLRLSSRQEWRAWSASGARPPNIPRDPSTRYTYIGWRGWAHWLGKQAQASQAPHATSATSATSATNATSATHAAHAAHATSATSAPNATSATRATNATSAARAANATHAASRMAAANTNAAANREYRPPATPLLPHAREYRPFAEGLAHARTLRLSSRKAWLEWCRSQQRPAATPTRPDRAYMHDGWQGWGHWLGTGPALPSQSGPALASQALLGQCLGKPNDADAAVTGATPPPTALAYREHLPFDDALAFARGLGLNSRGEWLEWGATGARPANIPVWPSSKYKHDGWQGWGHWLGNTKVLLLYPHLRVSITSSMAFFSKKG